MNKYSYYKYYPKSKSFSILEMISNLDSITITNNLNIHYYIIRHNKQGSKQ